uniref:DNA_MISMATCH_REPAIR_2 domain-containing protein n=1 Tax=Syphacia muris TaxID=451379 RepID=A0A158R415_9BILA
MLRFLALVEGRGTARGEIGFASMDALTSHITICQFLDSASYARLRITLHVLDPVEVIVPDTAFDNVGSKNAIVELLQNSFPDVEITAVSRRFFSDLRGAELVQQLGSAESSNLTAEVLKKYYCMSAVGALIKYVEYIQNVLFAQSSLKITYQTMEKTCFVDVNTLKNIEVIERRHTTFKEPCRSLFNVLNTCSTTGGIRMLRSCLLQPSADINIILARCDAIEELLGNRSVFERLLAVIGSAGDIQQLVTVCCHLSTSIDNVRYTEQKISEVLCLQQNLLLIEPLKVALESLNSRMFKSCYQQLSDPRFDSILDKLNTRLDSSQVIREKSSLANRYKRCYAIKEGQHVMVDLARKGYEELVRDIKEKAEEELCALPGARLIFTAQRGFHILVPHMDPLCPVKLSSLFIQVVKNRSSVSCTTRSLIRYNDRINETVNEIMIGSNIVIATLLDEIRPFISCLYHLIEVISLIDFLLALTTYASKTPTVRPTFSASNAVVIKQGRHPLLDLSSCMTVANDVYLSPESRLAIITGPNMAGKSTYLKQLCLLQILAQTGSFVPAEFAGFPVLSRIYSRIGHNDDLTSNLSSFAVEMTEILPLFSATDSASLVVIDELARSTGTEEGIALCFAICEELLKTQAFVVFATHFLDLTSLAAYHATVENYHFALSRSAAKGDNDGYGLSRKSHRLYRGPYEGPLYGFDIAELSDFPKEIISEARCLAEKLHTVRSVRNKASGEAVRRRIILRFGYKLCSMLPVLKAADSLAAKDYLLNLRTQFTRDLNKALDTSSS